MMRKSHYLLLLTAACLPKSSPYDIHILQVLIISSYSKPYCGVQPIYYYKETLQHSHLTFWPANIIKSWTKQYWREKKMGNNDMETLGCLLKPLYHRLVVLQRKTLISFWSKSLRRMKRGSIITLQIYLVLQVHISRCNWSSMYGVLPSYGNYGRWDQH